MKIELLFNFSFCDAAVRFACFAWGRDAKSESAGWHLQNLVPRKDSIIWKVMRWARKGNPSITRRWCEIFMAGRSQSHLHSEAWLRVKMVESMTSGNVHKTSTPSEVILFDLGTAWHQQMLLGGEYALRAHWHHFACESQNYTVHHKVHTWNFWFLVQFWITNSRYKVTHEVI